MHRIAKWKMAKNETGIMEDDHVTCSQGLNSGFFNMLMTNSNTLPGIHVSAIAFGPE